MKSPWLRPATHAGMLLFVPLTWFLGKWGMAGFAFAAFLVNLLVLPRTAFGRSLAREGEGRWNGLVAYPLAVALAYALFDPFVAAIAWAVMATGDPAATVVGRSSPGGIRIPWNRGKSVAGSAAFFAAATVGVLGVFYAFLFLLQFKKATGYWLPDLADLAFAAGYALVGALVESIPWPADDNLPVVLAVGGALTLHSSMMA